MKRQICVNDTVTITKKMKDGIEVFNAVITWVEERQGYVYFGYRPVGRSGWGNAKVYEAKKQYGIQDIKLQIKKPKEC